MWRIIEMQFLVLYNRARFKKFQIFEFLSLIYTFSIQPLGVDNFTASYNLPETQVHNNHEKAKYKSPTTFFMFVERTTRDHSAIS